VTTHLPTKPRIAIVRFSALGDVVMVSAAVNALQQALPEAEITWFTSPLTYALLQGIPGVQFVVTDKPRSFADYRAFYRSFREHDFDAVLAMQANLRINLLYPALRAPIKIGFDRIRAREGQWLFCNRRIPFHDDHLVDSFLCFVESLTGKTAEAAWNLPIEAADQAWATEQLSHLAKPLIAIHPHASKAERNWLPERYAEVIQRSSGSIVLTGGDSLAERTLCQQLCAIAPDRVLDLCGQTSPKQLASLLGKVDVLIAPDTGSVHIARAMDTPVIGLYAVASPHLTGPYQRTEYCVDRYPQAVRKYLGKDSAQLPWNTRVHHPDAMSLIQVDDVIQQLSRVLDGSR
jgi:heptosyltransferase I